VFTFEMLVATREIAHSKILFAILGPQEKVAPAKKEVLLGLPGLVGFSHISINVIDIDKALEFYKRVLGFEKMQGGKRWGDFDFREMDTEAFAKNAGFMDGHCEVDCVWMYHPHLQLNLELMRFHVPDVTNRLDPNLAPKTQDIGGIKHMSYVVEDISAAFTFLKQQPDVRFISDDPKYEPHQLEPFPFKFFYFLDPFGVQWEVEEYGDNVVTNQIPSVTRQMDAFIEFK
jgi:catechol 2,3-dioxygenase-like lactoylglutathione lyase family enzyme